MLDPKDLLPQPPWDGPPVPKGVAQPGVNKLRVIQEKLAEEIEWGESEEGRKIWKHEGKSKWMREEWGKVEGGMVTLFHGTDPFNVPRITTKGLTAGWDIPPEEMEGEEMAPKAVWLAATPYLAFFFGDTCVKVRIPLEWVDKANDGVLVERDIPPEMIQETMAIERWY